MALPEETPFSDDAAYDVIEDAREQIEKGGSRFRGMSYEEGVVAALAWALGDTDDIPYTQS